MALGTYQQVKDALKNFGITDYTVIDHPATHTTEEADAYIAGHEGVRTNVSEREEKEFLYGYYG